MLLAKYAHEHDKQSNDDEQDAHSCQNNTSNTASPTSWDSPGEVIGVPYKWQVKTSRINNLEQSQ